MFVRDNILALTLLGGLAACLIVLRVSTSPSALRDWAPEHAAAPAVQAYADEVTVRNVRNSHHAGGRRAAAPTHDDRSYRLDRLMKVWLVVERKPLRRAHLMLSFEFDGGDFILFSPEARLEKGETFSSLRGLFRQFELFYVVASERDAIGYRAAVLGHAVHLYELPLDEHKRRKLFLDVSGRAGKLAREPEFYHTIFNNVRGNVVKHLAVVAGRSGPAWKAWPARPERVAHKMRLLRPDASIEVLATRGLITELARACQDRDDFSDCIRNKIGNLSEGI